MKNTDFLSNEQSMENHKQHQGFKYKILLACGDIYCCSNIVCSLGNPQPNVPKFTILKPEAAMPNDYNALIQSNVFHSSELSKLIYENDHYFNTLLNNKSECHIVVIGGGLTSAQLSLAFLNYFNRIIIINILI